MAVSAAQERQWYSQALNQDFPTAQTEGYPVFPILDSGAKLFCIFCSSPGRNLLAANPCRICIPEQQQEVFRLTTPKSTRQPQE